LRILWRKSLKNKYFLLGLLILLGVSSLLIDFTPPLNKEILQAQDFITHQDYKTAIAKYKEILKKHPPLEIQVKINYQLGDLYSIYLSKNREAVQYYSRIMKISNDPRWLIKTQERLGEIYFSYLKIYGNSIPIYQKLSEFRPKLINQDFYRFRYALSTFFSGQKSLALSLFKEIQKSPAHQYYARSLYYEGLIYFEQKKWKNSIDTWKLYLKNEKRRDNIVQTKFLMANAYETIEELKVAYNIYYSILGEYPNTSVIQNRLKGIYERRVARKR
jgi:tetratricopeptide (TPR) repeat protein